MSTAKIQPATTATAAETTKTNMSGDDTAPSGFILKLFQMVNGAPDDIISWTPDGDAFVIGSDIKRLEAETLPQFFRHNRFQSLVRQLNFYSFRKINRERNVWVYQHSLFNRERPEDLHLVRRRTCLGLDGRKQRFGRGSGKKNSRDVDKDDSSSSVDTSTPTGKPMAAELQRCAISAKRKTPTPDLPTVTPAPKRAKPTPLVPVRAVTDDAIQDATIDKSMVSEVKGKEDVVESDYSNEAKNGNSLLQLKYTMMDAAEQSAVVSEVAMKLDQYAKLAKKSTKEKNGRRGGSGVVTPPYSSGKSVTSTLLTYDDDDCVPSSKVSEPPYTLYATGVVSSDGEDSLDGRENDFEKTQCKPTLKRANLGADETCATTLNLHDSTLVQTIVDRISAASHGSDSSSVKAKLAIIEFCLTANPQESDKNLFRKIVQVLSSCSILAAEFHSYRAALHPVNGGSSVNCVLRDNRATTLQQIWQSEANLSDAVRDFKTFAVNCISQATKEASSNEWNCDEKAVLKKMTQTWVHRSGKLSFGTVY